MFFSAYLGNNDENLSSWQEVIHRHANWLGLVSHIESRNLDDGRSFSFGWLKHKTSDRNAHFQETEEYLDMTTSDHTTHGDDVAITKLPRQRLIANVDTNVIRIWVSLRSGELRITIPPTTPEQFYLTSDSRGCVFGNDMRLMMRWAGVELDERAIYALFQYGAIPPPITISKTVQRVPNGHVLKIMPNSAEPIFEVFFQPRRKSQEDRESSNLEEHIRETLGSILSRVPTSAVLYFSGGVDSGLLSAQLAEIGRTDIRLINYVFGPQDKEGHLALEMAAHLGLACEQIMYDPSDISPMLERLGKDYSYPFGDSSVIPTNLLVHASLRLAERSHTIIEGTGADGAFGLGVKYPIWKLLYSVPNSMRWMIASAYKWLKIWQHGSCGSKVKRLGCAARRSVQMPLQHAAVIAQNSLDGIAYTIPDEVRENLEEVIRTRIQILSLGLGPVDQFSLLDLVHLCAGEMAAKSFDPLRTRGIKPIYPFLEPPMLRLSFSLRWDEKCEGGEAKAILKKILARSVPRQLVYRPKSTFDPPFQEILTYPSIQRFLRSVVISKDNPLIDFYRMEIVRQMIERAQHGQSLSIGAYSFLWVLMFISGWLRQLEL